MTANTTPAGAILYLLAVDVGAPLPIEEVLEAWLLEQELVELNDAGIVTLSERGTIWRDMILETPPPVAVARWGDPRQFPPLGSVVQTKLYSGASDAPPAPQHPAPGAVLPAPAPVPAGDGFVIPPGFNPNRWPNEKPGFMPPGLAPGDELMVLWRDGRARKMFTASIVWTQGGASTDVMAWRRLTEDELTT